MRDIKFRWVGLNKKFNEIQINEDLTVDKIIESEYLSFFSKSNRGELGNCKFLGEDLFSGLKDKNGKDIYEGDIVKIPEDYDLYGAMAGEIYQVYFAYGGFRLKPKYNSKAKGNWLEDGDDVEVIGNIYETPELIKK